jgi:hypothetical protein
MDVGLEVFLKTAYKKYKKLSLGVVCNQASNSKNLVHISKLVLDKKLGLKVSAFFGGYGSYTGIGLGPTRTGVAGRCSDLEGAALKCDGKSLA